MASTSSLTSAAYSARSIAAFNHNTKELANSAYRLTSGKKFVTGEDSATLALAALLQAGASSSRQGLQNTSHASSLVEIANGGLSQISDLLSHARGLAVQAQSGVLSDDERAFLQTAVQSDLDQIDAIANDTSFNQTKLLNGDLSESDGGATLTLSLGSGGSENSLSIEIRSASTDHLFAGGTPSLLSTTEADDAVDAIDDAAALIDTALAKLGGDQSKVDFAANNLKTQLAGLNSANSELSDTDVTQESTRYTSLFLQQQTSLAVLAQSRNLNSGLLGLLGTGTPHTTTASTTKAASTTTKHH